MPGQAHLQHRNGREATFDNGTRNRRDVWTIPTQPYRGAHFATFPEKLVEPCILAGCPVGGVVLDPFCGSGTTGAVAVRLGRRFVGLDMQPKYLELARERIDAEPVPLMP
jgi:DNA modification methylase